MFSTGNPRGHRKKPLDYAAVTRARRLFNSGYTEMFIPGKLRIDAVFKRATAAEGKEPAGVCLFVSALVRGCGGSWAADPAQVGGGL